MFNQTIGFAGMFMILFAFLMNQFHKWKVDSLSYNIFNALGGMLLTAYSLTMKSYPFVVLNVIWTIVAIMDIVIDVEDLEKKKAHLGHKRKA
ncbi:hypothetical protein JXA85_04385 [Candidatus Woesearchaeota archaeon]|nr:hypothetical protein [Candidatus Woesearchaeota archaeon]